MQDSSHKPTHNPRWRLARQPNVIVPVNVAYVRKKMVSFNSEIVRVYTTDMYVLVSCISRNCLALNSAMYTVEQSTY